MKKLWYMRVTGRPTVIRTLGTVPKGLDRGMEGVDEYGPSKLQNCLDQPEYWEKS